MEPEEPEVPEVTADGRHSRTSRWLVVIGFVAWSAGLALWDLSLVGGLAATLAGGVALADGLGRLARESPSSHSTDWVIGVSVGVSLLLISQGIGGVGRSDYVARVVLVAMGTLGMILVVLRILDQRLVIERALAARRLDDERALAARRLVDERALAAGRLVDERRRLAGEVHDVVGHTLSASMLHTTAARLSIRSNPDAAIASLERAEEQGRRSLDDIRSIVRLLRDPDGPGGPTPPVSELPELVEGFRAAGVDVTFVATGPLADLPTATALTAYRVVQEGLTNATRHGTGPINVSVRRSVGDSHVDIEIANDQAVRANAAADGTGLASMRERVSAIGGSLEAGPTADQRRWVLCARIPT